MGGIIRKVDVVSHLRHASAAPDAKRSYGTRRLPPAVMLRPLKTAAAPASLLREAVVKGVILEEDGQQNRPHNLSPCCELVCVILHNP